MERVMIIGCGGAGKSTLARKLGEKTGLPVVHLDQIWWEPGNWQHLEKPEFDRRLKAELEKPRWILDGNFNRTIGMRLAACDTVIFLDFPSDVCLEGIRARRGVPRSDLPWIETEEDEEFFSFVKRFGQTERPRILALLEQYKDRKNIIVLKDRREAERFLASLGQN